MNFFQFEGKKAIVTGGSRGLGNGIAEGFMAHGIETVLMATTPKLPAIAKEYCERGWKCHAIMVDLSNADARERAFAEAMECLGGRLDVLVNSAGVQRRHKAEEFPMEDWELVLEVNLTATFSLCQLAAREMMKTGGGKIINIASMLSYFGGFTVPAYAASKGGVAQLTKAFANEWACKNINVNALAPGYMATEMNTALINDEGRNREILARIPAKRWGTPEDMAGAALFLASEASNYLNGAIIPVDGGYLSR